MLRITLLMLCILTCHQLLIVGALIMTSNRPVLLNLLNRITGTGTQVKRKRRRRKRRRRKKLRKRRRRIKNCIKLKMKALRLVLSKKRRSHQSGTLLMMMMISMRMTCQALILIHHCISSSNSHSVHQPQPLLSSLILFLVSLPSLQSPLLSIPQYKLSNHHQIH